jgi:nucleoside-diphosphate-sugar epimerase
MSSARDSARILVTGATGFLGTHLGRELRQRGMAFAVFARSAQKARSYLDAGIEVCRGDLLDRASCDAATRGRDVVLHLAAAADVSDAAVNERVNVGGLQTLLRACCDNGVRRFIFVSSTCAGRERRDAYGETKLRGERLVRDSRIAHTILRPTMIYGRGSKEFETFVRVIQLSPVVPLIWQERDPAHLHRRRRPCAPRRR